MKAFSLRCFGVGGAISCVACGTCIYLQYSRSLPKGRDFAKRPLFYQKSSEVHGQTEVSDCDTPELALRLCLAACVAVWVVDSWLVEYPLSFFSKFKF
jgi:hypothetical protein